MYMYMYIVTCIYMYICTCILSYKNTYAYMHIPIYYTHTYIHTYIHTYTCTCIVHVHLIVQHE